MKLDINPFPVDAIDFEEKKVLAQIDQASTTTGKNVVVSGDLRVRMMKPRHPEVRVWKKNVWRKCWPEWRPTSSFLIEKYTREHRESVFNHLGGYKWRRSLEHGHRYSASLKPQPKSTYRTMYPN
jgi:hypothetical protein